MYNLNYAINQLNIPIYVRINLLEKYAVFGGVYGSYLLPSYKSSQDLRNEFSKKALTVETNPGYRLGIGYRWTVDKKYKPAIKMEWRRSKSCESSPSVTQVDIRYIRLCLGIEF